MAAQVGVAEIDVPNHTACMSSYWSSGDEAWIDAASHHMEIQLAEASLIPPIIHMVWLGGSMPPMLARVASTWRALHPDWTVVRAAVALSPCTKMYISPPC